MSYDFLKTRTVKIVPSNFLSPSLFTLLLLLLAHAIYGAVGIWEKYCNDSGFFLLRISRSFHFSTVSKSCKGSCPNKMRWKDLNPAKCMGILDSSCCKHHCLHFCDHRLCSWVLWLRAAKAPLGHLIHPTTLFTTNPSR